VTRNPLLDPAARVVIAHRGDQAAAPENTLAALEHAEAVGADALEFDIRMTRDGIPVLMHDETLNRTTNATGLLRRFTRAELETVDAGVRFRGGAATPHRIPTLEQVLDRFRALPLVIEVKERVAADATDRLIRRFGAQSRVLIGSADNAVMEWFYRTGLPTCASMLDAGLALPFALTGLAPFRPRYAVISVPPRFHGLPLPLAALARSGRRAGIPTQVWTVNDPADARRLWLDGIAGIVSDYPAAILGARPQ
jgi:glycerophosphoryl diester phosphodiesterase